MNLSFSSTTVLKKSQMSQGGELTPLSISNNYPPKGGAQYKPGSTTWIL